MWDRMVKLDQRIRPGLGRMTVRALRCRCRDREEECSAEGERECGEACNNAAHTGSLQMTTSVE
jgi:hypothetical protein